MLISFVSLVEVTRSGKQRNFGRRLKMTKSGIENILDFSNPVFSSYAFWSSILVIKCLLMSPLTGYFRFKNKAPASAEDAQWAKSMGIRAEFKMNANDPEVERVRKAHRNDLENILPYLFVGLFYVLTNPSVALAQTLFQIAAISRIVHSIVYAVIVVPQPARGAAWLIHYLITFYMALAVTMHHK